MPEDPKSIDVLVERFQAGVDQDESFRQIFALYYPGIIRFFRRKGFSYEESRDLTQESFFQIYRSLPGFRHESHFGRWAFEISWRIYCNEIRWRSSKKRHGLEQSLDIVPTEELRGGDLDALDEAIGREQVQALLLALDHLPEQMRRCCMLRYEAGLKYQEIATVMNVSIESVKAHLHQARKRLQKELGEAEER